MENVIIRDAIINNPKIAEELGRKLYVGISNVIQTETGELEEQDCIDYMMQLVVDRTFNGYLTGISAIYGQLQNELKYKIEPAPDNWDRLFDIDFYILVNERYVGLRIKHVNQGIDLAQIFKERGLQEKTHEKFTKQFGGKVFYIFSAKVDDKKMILNIEVIDEIKTEIKKLSDE